jgi:two-component system phosphate regulon sensor histidine kinase PhoR
VELSLSVRNKLLLVSVVLIAVSMAVAEVYLAGPVAEHLAASARADLAVRTHLLAREAASTPVSPSEGQDAWQHLAESMAAEAGVHVTIFRSDALVLGDSAKGSAPEAPRGESPVNPPEVEAAIARGEGADERRDGTQAVEYTAASFRRDGQVAGVIRLAEPLIAVERARADMRQRIGLGAAVALALGILFSNIVAKRISSAVDELTETARRMASGDLSVRTRPEESGELAELGHALDRLAGSLAATLGELRAERDRQARILETMQEGVVVLDRDGRIVMVNPALRAMLLLGADAVGKLLIETVRHAQLEDLLEIAREEGEEVHRPAEIELPGLKPRRMLVHASQLPRAPEDEGLLVVFVDVTELRRLESLRRDFVANASHELRTPIAAVRSATETLRSGALDDPMAAIRFVDIIDRNAQRLQSLLEDMLELSKLESNEFKLKRDRVELGRVVPIVLALFRERAEKKGVRLGAELPPKQTAVEGDARALEHVLSNLVDNAVKYCPAGTKVTVSAAEEDDRVKLVVSDSGPGIASEHLPRVFERFYRVDAGRSRDVGGTGLGLSIVKHMVEAMRGRVAVESEVGRGSTFTVSLPRSSA